jgi:MFS transporter, DHA1 family, multidrug resistance protein
LPQVNIATKGGQRLLIVILGIMGMFPALASDVYLPAFPEVAREFHVTINQVQFTLAASMVGMGLGMLVWGSISDRLGRKTPAIIGSITYLVASLLCILAPNLTWLIGWRLVQGIGGSAAVVIGRAIVRDLYSGREMARLMMAIQTIFFITPVLAPSIGAFILSFANWQALFVLMAALGAVGAVGVWALPESLKAENRVQNNLVQAFRTYGKVFADGNFRQYMWQNGASVMVTIVYISTTADVYLQHFKVPEQAFGLIFGVTAFGQMVGAQVNRRLLMRFSVERLLVAFVIGQFTFATCLFIVGHLTDNIWLVMTFQVLTIFCGGSIGGNGTTLALRDYQVNAGSGVALLALAQSLGGALAATLTAYLPFTPVVRMTTGMGVAAFISFSLMASRQIHKRQIP